MALKVSGYIETLSGACGVAHANDFMYMRDYNNSPWYTPHELEARGGGAGWLTAGFVNDPVCKTAYELLCSKATLVYQTPVRRNRNSGNRFFFAVFDCGRRRNA